MRRLPDHPAKTTQRPVCPGCGEPFPHPYDERDHDCDCPWWCWACLAKFRGEKEVA
jgi:hypothetical protein